MPTSPDPRQPDATPSPPWWREALPLLPLLPLYGLVVLLFSQPQFQGDEERYLQYARNLLEGFYSPPHRVELWNGPGYPLFLVPFVALGLPTLAAKLANALLWWGAVLQLRGALGLYLPPRTALLLAGLTGLHPLCLYYLPTLLTEHLGYFLLSGFVHHFLAAARRPGGGRFWWAGVYLGGLILTKVFFAMVAVAALVVALGIWWWRRGEAWRRLAGVAAVGLVILSPYLAYTWQLTGRPFYLGHLSGHTWYWMNSGHPEEYGDWFALDQVRANPVLVERHGAFLKEAARLGPMGENDRLMARAVEKLRADPLPFLRNWLANTGRLFFSYPYSYTPQKLSTYYVLLPNGLLLAVALAALYPTWSGRRRLPPELFPLLLVMLVYLGGSTLVTVSVRQFLPVLFILVPWLALVWERTLEIRLLR